MPDVINGFLTEYGSLLIDGTIATLIMTTAATVIAYLIGIPIGVIVTITAPDSLRPQPLVYAVLGWIVNIGRSIPFVILLVALIPVSRFIAGTSLGTTGAIVPLTIGAIPFVARLVEGSLSEIGPGRIEAAQAFGANTLQIITKVLLRESLPSLIRGGAITYITLIGYSAIAGAVGAGGLGDIAIRFGYYRYQDEVMIATIILLIVLVQVIQSISDIWSKKIDRR